MEKLARALRELVPSIESVGDVRPVGGGCISAAHRVVGRDLSGQLQSLFVKSNRAEFLDNFQAEWDGLLRLRRSGVIVVPQPIAVGQVGDQSLLVTEWIERHSPDARFYSEFGTALASLHRVTLGTEIGLERDNFLGSARQQNTRCDSWVEFVASHRIGFQLRWAVDQQRADSSLRQLVERIIAATDQLLAGRDQATSLLHGDLWSGNYLCTTGGQAALIDPAVYHGCREAEFGMLRLFGSCPETFYEAYLNAFPLPDGWQRRASVYVLYHLLNHLNLFGTSYLGQCKAVASQILRA